MVRAVDVVEEGQGIFVVDDIVDILEKSKGFVVFSLLLVPSCLREFVHCDLHCATNAAQQ